MYRNYLEKPFVTTKAMMKHSEFGHCNNPNWRWTSQWNPNEPIHPAEEARPPYYILLSTYFRCVDPSMFVAVADRSSYILLIVIGHMRDFFGKKFFPAAYAHLQPYKVR